MSTKQWKTWEICTIQGAYALKNLTSMPDIVTISRVFSDYVTLQKSPYHLD